MRPTIWQSKVSYYISPANPSSPLLSPRSLALPPPLVPSLHSILLHSFALVTSSLIHFQSITFLYSKSKHSSLPPLPLPSRRLQVPLFPPFPLLVLHVCSICPSLSLLNTHISFKLLSLQLSHIRLCSLPLQCPAHPGATSGTKM